MLACSLRCNSVYYAHTACALNLRGCNLFIVNIFVSLRRCQTFLL